MSPRHLSRLSLCAAAIGALAIAAFAIGPSRASEEAVIIPPPAVDVQAADGIQTAVIAGGCFWGVQGVYQHTAGVLNAVSGPWRFNCVGSCTTEKKICRILP